MPKVSRSGSRRQQEPPQEPVQTTTVRPIYSTLEMSDRSRISKLVIGDILCFLIFVILGTSQHGEGFNLLYSAWLALPFLVAWFIIAPFMGTFRADLATQPGKMLARTMLAWLVSWPLAMFLRWLAVERVKTPPVTFDQFFSFAMVALTFNAGLLLLWRWPFALNNNLRKRGL